MKPNMKGGKRPVIRKKSPPKRGEVKGETTTTRTVESDTRGPYGDTVSTPLDSIPDGITPAKEGGLVASVARSLSASRNIDFQVVKIEARTYISGFEPTDQAISEAGAHAAAHSFEAVKAEGQAAKELVRELVAEKRGF